MLSEMIRILTANDHLMSGEKFVVNMPRYESLWAETITTRALTIAYPANRLPQSSQVQDTYFADVFIPLFGDA